MELIKMNTKSLKKTRVGEAITLTAVMAILAAAIVAAVICSLVMSDSGTVTIPGGWNFSWGS
ncbi:MAG: hypothetical protein LUB56_00865 [Coprobacillus sp.]|nr:hypothetical protein [Coprobacillus sp.]